MDYYRHIVKYQGTKQRNRLFFKSFKCERLQIAIEQIEKIQTEKIQGIVERITSYYGQSSTLEQPW